MQTSITQRVITQGRWAAVALLAIYCLAQPRPAQSSPAAPRYEYQQVHRWPEPKTEDLNRLGAQGYHVVAAVRDYGNTPVIIFERKLP